MLKLGPLRLDPVSLRLQAPAGVVRLRPKAAALLVLLATRPGETFAKRELLDMLWPDIAVNEKNLAILVGEIRRALTPLLGGDPAVTTIPGAGYRLAIPVADDSKRVAPIAALAGESCAPAASTPCVLLLPFRVSSSPAVLTEAADSITASLTTRLASIVRVVLPSRSAAWSNAGSISEETSADLLVAGSAFAEGNRIRINLHVLDAVGRIVLWADQITTTREHLFEAEDRLCERIVGRIAALCARGRSPIGEASCLPRTLRAYRLGCHFLSRRTAGSLIRARHFFTTVLEAEERFAPALAGLAHCWAVEAYYTDADPRSCAEHAVELSRRALEIDANLSQAFAAGGFAHLNLLEWEKAAEHLRRAMTLDPLDVEARHYYSEYLTCVGQHEEAIRTMRAALQLEPTSRILNSDFGKILMLAGRLEEAADQFRMTIDLEPDFALAHYRLGLALACQGKFSEALETCTHAAELFPEASLYGALRACCEAISGRRREATEILHRLQLRGAARPGAWYGTTLLHLELGEKNVALETLRHAVEQRAPLTIYAQVDPLLDGLRRMPRFPEVGRELAGHA